MILWEATKKGISLLYGTCSVDEQRTNIRNLAAQSSKWNKKNLTKYINILNGGDSDSLEESMSKIALEEADRKDQEQQRKEKLNNKSKRYARPSKKAPPSEQKQ